MRTILRNFLITTAFVALAASAMAQPVQQFSADMVTWQGKKQADPIPFYVSGEKSRMDLEGSSMIVRRDKNVMWMVMPEKKTYMEMAIDSDKLTKTYQEIEGEVSREPLGTEELNGMQVEKSLVTYEDDGKTKKMYQWIKDGAIAVRSEDVDGKWAVEFQNLNTDKPDDSLFEPPADYEAMQMPTMKGLMKGIFGQ